MNLKFPSITR